MDVSPISYLWSTPTPLQLNPVIVIAVERAFGSNPHKFVGRAQIIIGMLGLEDEDDSSAWDHHAFEPSWCGQGQCGVAQSSPPRVVLQSNKVGQQQQEFILPNGSEQQDLYFATSSSIEMAIEVQPKTTTSMDSLNRTGHATSSEPTDSSAGEAVVPFNKQKKTLSQHWASFVQTYAHAPILHVTRRLARTAALYPKRTIVFLLLLSFGILGVGLATNFNVDVDTDEMWTPIRSYPVEHSRYIADTFEPPPRYFILFFHANGNNIVNANAFRNMFTAVNIVQEKSAPACSELGDGTDRYGVRTCEIYGVTKFWWNNITEFESALSNSPNVIHTTTAKRAFLDNIPVLHEEIFGFLEMNATHVNSAQSTTIVINLPEDPRIRAVENDMVQQVLALNEQWGEALHVEVLAYDSIPDELIRAVNNDIPLIPIVFVAMSLFTSAVFSRRHKVYSRGILGAGAVVAIMLSLATGFGLLFIIGTPFTPITQLLPFLIFGIGLDDAFIIMGSYTRTSNKKDVVERIDETVRDIGLSIFLTTLTSAIAFALGCTSSIPAVFWLCQYCCPTIVIVFIYQLSFFVACITLDEKRIQDGRRDIFFWVRVKEPIEEEPHTEHFADRIMKWYAYQLLRPIVRVIVVVGFVGLFGACIYSTTLMRQQFKLSDVLPKVSYAVDFLDATTKYQDKTLLTVQVVFRDVDQSDPTVRQEMMEYIDELSSLDISLKNSSRSDSHWTTLFNFYSTFNADASGLSFNEQLDGFLAVPFNQAIAGPDIVRDENGDIVASRVRIKFEVDLEDVQNQINVLETQRGVTLSQPVNQGREGELAFFSFDEIFTVFEFYLRSVAELTSTTVIGVFAVTLVALIFIPHWTAALFVCPLICILYIDLIGVMQWGGLHINSLTFISLTMSIGLLVDFVMHILFRYYEVPGNRVEKTIEMLRTMGSSILLGGTTTFLGTLPLMFTSSDAFRIMFVSFVGIVTIGVGHGLILLPVVLATIGPEDEVSMSAVSDHSMDRNAIAKDLSLINEEEEVFSDASSERKTHQANEQVVDNDEYSC